MKLSQWQHTIKDKNDLIVQASTIEMIDGVTNTSIGMHGGYLEVHHEYETLQTGKHEELVFFSINLHLDGQASKYIRGDGYGRPCYGNRRSVVENLRKNNIYLNNEYLSSKDYFHALPNYKFVISPEGLGIDCHRHYEALMAGCIPIVQKDQLLFKKYGNVPMLTTIDYSEITIEYLKKIYAEMCELEYDFTKLFFSNLSKQEQSLVIERSNAWVFFSFMKNVYYKHLELNNYDKI